MFEPLRIALLGDSGSGKSTFQLKLSTNQFVETYYPTSTTTPTIFEFLPQGSNSRLILSGDDDLKIGEIEQHSNLILSPLYFQKDNNKNKKTGINLVDSKVRSKNPYYDVIYEQERHVPGNEEPSALITPMLVEIIDTPPFKPDQIVPFLEASLDIKLPPDILHNLANEPRRDHSAKPLIVASGAHELNGKVDGYLLMYSSVPSLNPPTYEAIQSSSNNNEGHNTDPIALLKVMRAALIDAWKEYVNYKTSWEKGAETDVFSLIYSVKSLWKKNKILRNEQKKAAKERHEYHDDNDNNRETFMEDEDSVNPETLPPITIVCTNADSKYKSPILIEEGKKLAKSWKCGFAEISSLTNENVEECLSIIIRQVVEKELFHGKD